MRLAERIALDLEADIAGRKLKRGDLLGAESDLVMRLRTSRWTLREALGLLELEGRVEVRRGRGGGVFVAKPGFASVVHILWSYLELVGVNDIQILEARVIFDQIALTLAARRVSVTDVARLRSNEDLDSPTLGIAAGIQQFEALLDVCGNPLAAMFVRTIGQLGMNAILRSNLSDAELEDNMRQTRRLRRDQIEAVIAGDLPLALSLESRILQHTRKLLKSTEGDKTINTEENRARALRMLSGARRYKRPELLMHEIASDVMIQGLDAGARLGSEADLIAQYGVSRTVFREGIRALERAGIVEMRSGRHSGLFVVAPDPSRTLHAAMDVLDTMSLSPALIGEVLAPAIAGAVAKFEQGALRQVEEGSFLGMASVLGFASGNPILALFAELLINMLERVGGEQTFSRYRPELVKACADGDRSLLSRVVLEALSRPLACGEEQMAAIH